MFFDIEIDEELFDVPLTPPRLTPPRLTPPRLTRQYGCSDLLALSNQVLSIDTEVNFDEYIFRSLPNLGNSSNLSNIGTNNLPKLKKYNSDSKQTTKSPNIKRINTF